MKLFVVPVLLGVTLGGCGIDKMIHEDDLQASRVKCTDYGFKPGSVEFANCMQRSVEGAEQERDRSFHEQRRRGEREVREKK